MDGSAAFDAIAQEQSKKATLSNQTANSNYAINTSDGNIIADTNKFNSLFKRVYK